MVARERVEPRRSAAVLGAATGGWVTSALLVLALLGGSWGVVYLSGGARIAPHLFYLPILVAAARLGPVGAVLTSLLAALLAGPLLPLDVEKEIPQPLSDWASRGAYFVGIGLFSEYLFRRLRRTERDLTETRAEERRQDDGRLQLLRQLDHERRALLARVVGAQEEERRRIASDLHDDTIQVMSALRMRLGVLRGRTADPETAEQLARLEDTAHDAIARLRRLMFDLHPTELNGRGLVETIRDTMPEVLGRSGVDYELEGGLEEEPPADVGAAAYRIVREALHNVRKHAGASRAVVAVEGDGGRLSIRVTDDGVGFTSVEPEMGHLGLLSMRERAESIGGRCTITSTPRRGTTVHVELPLAPSDLNHTA